MGEKKPEDRIGERYRIMVICFTLIFAVIVVQLANLQIINGEYYDEKSQTKLLAERDIIAPRGKIVDRNGIPIAVNRMGYAVKIAKTSMTENEKSEMILKLISIFEKNGDSYEKNLSYYLTFNPIAFGPRNQSQDALQRWKKDMVVKPDDMKLLETPEDVFRYLRKKFSVDEKYTDEEAYKIMTIKYDMLIKGYTATNPLLVAKDVKVETVAQIEERSHEFPGVLIDIIPQRKYLDAGSVAHVLGYIGIISEDEYKKYKENGYGMNDMIGKEGIEKTQESQLRGINGRKRVEVDTNGRLTAELSSEPAIPGNDVVLTIDMRLQKAAMKSLESNIERIKSKADYKKNFGDAFAGAAVAIDVNSGEVLAMASYPTYDPSVFLAGPQDKEAQKTISNLFSDEKNKPLFNRAIQGRYTPGSTYKPLSSIAGLETGVITPQNSYITDRGTHVIGGWTFKCMEYPTYGHGKIDVIRALATSCNIYFHELGVKVGIDNIDAWAKNFGLGEYTGIELPGEQKGIRANKQTKKELRNDDWRPADTAQSAIGQFDNAFTPIQLANYVSTLANGGKRYKPHVVKEIRKYDGSTVLKGEPEYEKLSIKEETMKIVHEGMLAVANAEDGTVNQLFSDFPFTVAGKTGTPETGLEHLGQSSNGVFIAYAPADNPQIAVAVVIEHGVWGSEVAPVAKDILREYFGMNSDSLPKDKIVIDKASFTR
ncbi:penicillin-binding protein 2 [Acetivibrio straminisolvens]|jgi:penicillin-binding protein 2|uniref:penicillin-binding protein 2 n=1 Tax=Acetivibrio straminisolvens TaxID=253314 RepID=UPI002240CFA7|nr:penicillin-binding protein 2 [Acetivibrio straminisolvens]